MIDNYSKLTIGKYLEVKEILSEDMDALEQQASLIAVLNDMETEDVLDLPLGTYNKLLQSLGFLMELPKPRQAPPTKYKIDGIEYDVMLNIQDMTIAQYIDYQTFLKEGDKYIVELLSVFIIPRGHKYSDGYDIADVQKKIREKLSIIDAVTLSAFFLSLSQALISSTVRYSIKRMKRLMRKEKNLEMKKKYQEAIAHLEQSGVGLV